MERAEISKCHCGSKANLFFINTGGRIKEKFVTVHNVPTYICSECDFGFHDGPEALRYAKRVKEAVALGVDVIEF